MQVAFHNNQSQAKNLDDQTYKHSIICDTTIIFIRHSFIIIKDVCTPHAEHWVIQQPLSLRDMCQNCMHGLHITQCSAKHEQQLPWQI